MPLVSVYDPAPHRPETGPLRGVRGYVASVVYLHDLDSLLLAQGFALSEVDATMLAERVAWGFWRAGFHPPEKAYRWQEATNEAMRVHPYAPRGLATMARATEAPDGVVFVVGSEKAGVGGLEHGMACADLGMIMGPARWDHRSQYSTVRRVATGQGWSTVDAIDEQGALPAMRQRRKGPPVVEVLRTLSEES